MTRSRARRGPLLALCAGLCAAVALGATPSGTGGSGGGTGTNGWGHCCSSG